MNAKGLKISEVAKAAQVNRETVRYYERRGLIPTPPRRESGYRDYPPETVDRILFIKRAQDLGFTLSEVEDLLSLAEDENVSCADVRFIAEKKLADIKLKIERLQRLFEALSDLVETCRKEGSLAKCPILECLIEERR